MTGGGEANRERFFAADGDGNHHGGSFLLLRAIFAIALLVGRAAYGDQHNQQAQQQTRSSVG